MTIVVVCQFCRTRFRFRDDAAGQRVVCEHCGDVLSVPLKDPTGNGSHARRFGDEMPSASLRELGPPRPVDPTRPDRPRDPKRPAVSDSMYKLGIGLRLVLCDALLSGLIYVTLTLSQFILVPPQPFWFRLLAALQFLWVAVMLLGMIGRGLCLLVPTESQAKPYILTSLLLEFFFMMVTVVDLGQFSLVPDEAQVAGQICQLFAHVLFLGFLRRLATYLQRDDLLAESQKSFSLGAVLVVASLVATLSRFFVLHRIAMLFYALNFIVGPMLFFPYLRLLYAFYRAVRDLERSGI